MSFAEFQASIVSSNLSQVALVWKKACQGRPMPAWSDISPAMLKPQLPIVWSYIYDADRDDFVGRLAGIAISNMSGGRFKGLWLSELRPPDMYPRSLARARRVVKEPALYRGEGLVYKTADNFGYGERIALPLSTDGHTPDGIFGATEYRNIADWDASSPAARTEIEHW